MRSSYQCTCKATCTHCVVFLMHFALPDQIFFCAVPDIFAQCQGLIKAFTTTSHALFHICMYKIEILALSFSQGVHVMLCYACTTLNTLMHIAGYPRGLYGSVRLQRLQRREGRAGKECQSLNKYVCVQNPTLCPGLLGINDYRAVYFGILYKCLIRSQLLCQ